jgi:hypothetical protein
MMLSENGVTYLEKMRFIRITFTICYNVPKYLSALQYSDGLDAEKKVDLLPN